jgi:hypothetical protein
MTPAPVGGSRVRGEVRGVQARVIAFERSCAKCGYNVQGLRWGQNCPECGTPIRSSSRFSASMVDAPIPELRRIALAARTLAWCTLAGAALAIASRVALEPVLAFLAALAALGAAWGVWQITRRVDAEAAALHEGTARTWQVALARWGSLAWAGACVLLAMLLAASNAAQAGLGLAFGRQQFIVPAKSAWMAGVASLLLVVGLAALGLLAVRLADLAQWGNDDETAQGFYTGAWCVLGGGGGVLALAFATPLLGSLAFLGVVALVLFAGALALGVPLMMWNLLRLARTCAWAVTNARDALGTQARRAERVRADARFKTPGEGPAAYGPSPQAKKPADDGSIPLEGE